jgi:hypothetical protein
MSALERAVAADQAARAAGEPRFDGDEVVADAEADAEEVVDERDHAEVGPSR